ncbi:hypothetical protein P7C70_g8812, partial [Phenoliferia sp. Uapishka_3]
SLFHDLKVAFEVLCDPIKKASFDALLAARNARKLRFAGLDNKRKALAEDLDRREKEFKRTKGEEVRERGELERLKEQGRKMREEREKEGEERGRREMGEKRDEQERVKREEERERRKGAVELGPLDMTLKIKWAPATHPTILDADSLQSTLSSLLKPNPVDIDSVVISTKFKANPTKGKHASAVVSFKSLAAAVRVMKARESGGVGWEGLEVNWAAGSPPAVLGGERKADKEEVPKKEERKVPSFMPAMMVDSSEDRILAQLRAKERQKLMDEMRRQEEEEQ